MKISKHKKVISAIIVVTTILTLAVISVSAHRNVANYSISVGYSGKDSGSLTKCHNGNETYGRYRVAVDQTTASGLININTKLENSDHESRGSGKVAENTTGTFTNSAVVNYNYHVNLKREYVWDSTVTVVGSWSPDEPH